MRGRKKKKKKKKQQEGRNADHHFTSDLVVVPGTRRASELYVRPRPSEVTRARRRVRT